MLSGPFFRMFSFCNPARRNETSGDRSLDGGGDHVFQLLL